MVLIDTGHLSDHPLHPEVLSLINKQRNKNALNVF